MYLFQKIKSERQIEYVNEAVLVQFSTRIVEVLAVDLNQMIAPFGEVQHNLQFLPLLSSE